MSNPVAAGLSQIRLLNLTREETVQTRLVLEVYDGKERLQVEFEDVDHFLDVVERSPDDMMEYFQSHLFEGPEMGDPREILASMAARAGDEGLVTVPPEDDDERLFDAMTNVFQNAADLAEASGRDGLDPDDPGDDFIQSLLRDRSPDVDDEGNGR